MLSVLVVSPHPSVPGGVSVFIEGVKRHAVHTSTDSFYVGSTGRGGGTVFATAKRLLVAPIELARCVSKKKFDVVHLNPSFDAKSLIRDSLLLLALRLVGFRHILLYFHGWDFAIQKRIKDHEVLRRLMVWTLNKATLITVLGDAFRDGLIMIGIDPSRIVVTRTMFEGAGLKTSADQPPPGTRPFILFLSRFDREKGGRELLGAFASVANDYPELDLVMAGEGADGEFLRAQAKILGLEARVLFPGYVSGEEKARLLRDCTLFALPTTYRSEGMPVAVLEAMGAGKPLLVGSAGAMRSIASDPENGVVLKGVSASSVEAGLRRLLSDKAFAESTGKHNAKIAWEKFEAHAVTDQIEQFYQKVAQC